MTRAHFFIVLAAFFGFCSIVFDQIAYQYEKSSSSLQIEINVLSEKSEELSVLNKATMRLTERGENDEN